MSWPRTTSPWASWNVTTDAGSSLAEATPARTGEAMTAYVATAATRTRFIRPPGDREPRRDATPHWWSRSRKGRRAQLAEPFRVIGQHSLRNWPPGADLPPAG